MTTAPVNINQKENQQLQTWIQQKSHVLEINFQNAKISLQDYLTELNQWRTFKNLVIYQNTKENKIYIIKCTFDLLSEILVEIENNSSKNDYTFSNLVKPQYFLKYLNIPVKRLNVNFQEFKPNPINYQEIASPINIDSINLPIDNPESLNDHKINFYFLYKSNGLYDA